MAYKACIPPLRSLPITIVPIPITTTTLPPSYHAVRKTVEERHYSFIEFEPKVVQRA